MQIVTSILHIEPAYSFFFLECSNINNKDRISI